MPATAINLIEEIIDGWEVNQQSYHKLSEDIKDFDREWADKVLDHLPIKCPVWQCGGIMKSVERNPPEGSKDEWADGYDGDWQTPDLVCTNCGANYIFSQFRKI